MGKFGQSLEQQVAAEAAKLEQSVSKEAEAVLSAVPNYKQYEQDLAHYVHTEGTHLRAFVEDIRNAERAVGAARAELAAAIQRYEQKLAGSKVN